VILAQYCSGDKIEKTGWAGRSTFGGRRGVCRVLVGKPERKTPLGRPRHIQEDNIKVNPQEVEYGTWTGSSWLRIESGGGHL